MDTACTDGPPAARPQDDGAGWPFRRRGGARRTAVAVALACLALLTGCTAHPPTPGDAGGTSGPTRGTAAPADGGRMVDIGGGRRMYLDCRGSGSPTVILISGTGGAADEWMGSIPVADPTAPPTPSADSVFDTLAGTGRVCAYDRPGTTLLSDAPGRSTPVPQPTTARQGAGDLNALLAAAGEPGPYVVVGASWGGMIAQQFAALHPREIKGLVLVDSASAYLKQTLTPAQWSGWMAVNAAAHAKTPDAESPDYLTSVAQLQSGPRVPHVRAVVLSSDRPWDLAVTPGASTWPAWLQAQDLLARSLSATHVSDTHSGHGLAVEQPALVASAIQRVVRQAR